LGHNETESYGEIGITVVCEVVWRLLYLGPRDGRCAW
jgi:hypothetical protein